MKIYSNTLLLGVGSLIVCSGCGGGGDEWTKARPKVVPVSGVVLYKGSPLAGASVTFSFDGEGEEDAAHGAFGQTDANGRFQLMTFESNDGAVPGTYKVQVVKVEVLPSQAEEEGIKDYDLKEYFANTAKFQKKKTSQVPSKYSKPQSTPLSAEVVDGAENDFTFELNDD